MGVSWLSQSESDLPGSPHWLTTRERERLDGMRYTKRRLDYLLGRWTAKCAVAHSLGLAPEPEALARVEVCNADDGAPEALLDDRAAPVAISITDRAGWGVCAVAAAGAEIGCDLELVEPRSAAFVADYLTFAERARVADAADEEDHQLLANLFWSAKESALKVLRTGLRRDTRSVEVTLADEPALEGWSRLRVRTGPRRVLPGWWRRYGPFVLTFAASFDTAPPTSIVEPPALASGVPTHSWLAAPRA